MRLTGRVRQRPCPTEFDSPEQDRPEATETDPDRAQLYLTEQDPRTSQTVYESYRRARLGPSWSSQHVQRSNEPDRVGLSQTASALEYHCSKTRVRCLRKNSHPENKRLAAAPPPPNFNVA